MYERVLAVKYITSKHCFCMLSPTNLRHIRTLSIKLTDAKDRSYYFSVDNSPGPNGDSYVYISSIYARLLKLEENSTVVLTEINKPPTVQSVTVTCLNAEDYCVLELLAENVQSTLLQQVRVLSTDQCFVIWSGNIFIPVTVCDIQPKSPGFIDNFTAVVIQTPSERAALKNNSKLPKSPDDLLLRVVHVSKLKSKELQFSLPFNVFISRKEADFNSEPQIYSMKLLGNDEKNLLYVRLQFLQDFDQSSLDQSFTSVSAENMFVSDAVWKYFQGEQGSRVFLQYCNELPSVNEIEVFARNTVNIASIFREFLARNCEMQPFVLSPNITYNLSDNVECYVRFLPSQAKFCLVDQEFVRNCKICITQSTNLSETYLECKETQKLQRNTLEITNFQEIVHNVIFLLTDKLESFVQIDNILIEGKRGSGKSTLVRILSEMLQSIPHVYHVKIVRCKTIKGKTCESLHKMFIGILFDLIHCQPSVLILDDLDVLCENTNDSDPLAQNAIYFNRISEMLESLFDSFRRNNSLAILATTQSVSKLNKSIYSSRGNHLFKNVFHINNLERSDREKLLKFSLDEYDIADVDFGDLVQKTDSFSLQDLTDFVNKAQFESYQNPETLWRITQANCDIALEQVSSTILDGVSKLPQGLRDLCDVGGLRIVKKLLLEIMLWPAKYPTIFDNAPLKLPSGLLLYGPPGTGKTILAGAIAKHCSLRLISVKGPELLSKYIGASEQAVRDVFQRAQNAKPCLLFFDEFDSLAPRRGHDNTGVTDRVVNQLLTQLDGVESLTGVFILAATSRPDLLDPALLRPGRLDRHVHCNLPDEVERLDILQALSKSLTFAKNCSLDLVAKETQWFSGADLQAVLYTAQLEAMKYLVDEENEHSLIEITQELLMDAVRKTRPSLNSKELAKYERIYKHFEGGSTNDFEPGTRATLA